MAITSGLFNSINGDRRYDAKWFARYFATFIGNGVFPNPSTGLQVIENENMTVTVKPGDGWINGYFIVNDSDHVLQHDLADGVLKRIDRIMMRLDYSDRQIDIVIKKGAFASNPVAPSLQRDADAYELALADVFINNGATTITQANITDQRLNNEVCGIVHGLINQVNTTTIFNQYTAWFNGIKDGTEQEIVDWQQQQYVAFTEWISSIQDILDGDVATNLASRIHHLESQVTNISNEVDGHINDILKHSFYAIASGSGTYTATVEDYVDRYVEGFKISIKTPNVSTVNATLNVNGLGARHILKSDGSNVNDLKANGVYTLVYSGTAFILQGEGGIVIDGVLDSFLKSQSVTNIKNGTFVGYEPYKAVTALNNTSSIRTKTIRISDNVSVVFSGLGNLRAVVAVATDLSTTLGTPVYLETYDQNGFDVTLLENNKILLVTSDTSSGTLTARTLQVSNTDIIVNSKVTMENVYAYRPAVCKMSTSNRAMVTYEFYDQPNGVRDIQAMVLNINGTTITTGARSRITSHNFTTGVTQTPPNIVHLESEKCLITYTRSNNLLNAVLVLASGNSVSVISNILSLETTGAHATVTKRISNNKVLVVYADGTNSNRPAAVILTISASNVISKSSKILLNTTLTFDSSDYGHIEAVTVGESRAYVIFRASTILTGNSQSLKMSIVDLSLVGTSIIKKFERIINEPYNSTRYGISEPMGSRVFISCVGSISNNTDLLLVDLGVRKLTQSSEHLGVCTGKVINNSINNFIDVVKMY